jgi:8-oxo-dGTP pyrophosphatase MutT (NUDIX family)/membrane-associated phospholipid phosphatase
MFVSTASVAEELVLPETVKGAVCIVRSGDKIVVTDELITGKLSFPGGGISPGESAKIAVERETWEEAGLIVTANKVLHVGTYTVYFDCVSDDKIVAFSAVNQYGGFDIPIWFAPHYSIEVRKAMLIDPNFLDKDNYRYPEQLALIAPLIEEATDHDIESVGDLISAAPKFHQAEIKIIALIQNAIHSLPAVISLSIISLLKLGNLLLNPITIVAIAPLILWRYGRVFAIEVVFIVSVTAILTLVAQIGLGLPRPFVYLPQLELINSIGYGLPAVLSAVSASLIILCLHRAHLLYWNRVSVAAIAILLWQGLSMIVLGVHFFSDVVAGWIFGALTASHLIKLEQKPDIKLQDILLNKVTWWSMSAMCVGLLIVWPQPVFANWLAFLITMSALVSVRFVASDLSVMPLSKVIRTVVLLGLITVLLIVTKELLATSSLYSLIMDSLHYPIIALALVLMFPRERDSIN